MHSKTKIFAACISATLPFFLVRLHTQNNVNTNDDTFEVKSHENTQKNIDTLAVKDPEQAHDSTEITIEEFVLNKRIEAIDNAIKYQGTKNSFSLKDGKKIVLAQYSGSVPDNIPDGLVIFEILDTSNYQIFTELKEDFGVLSGDFVFDDITGDGFPEIFSNWANEKANHNNIWLYTMQGENFVPLNFAENTSEPRNRLITYGYGDKVEDIDNDGVKELLLGKRIEKDDSWIMMVNTYKFNGTEYYLWKEEPFSYTHDE